MAISKNQHRAHGFSLLEISVAIIIAGMIAVLGMKYVGGGMGNSKCYAETQQKLQRVREAVNRYAMSNGRFPRPALRTVGSDDPQFGREVTAADVTAGKVDRVSNGAMTPLYALYGALPFSTLTISRDDGVDCWGNKFSYVVTEELTDKDRFEDASNPPDGAFGIKTDATKPEFFLDQAGFAVISHGADQWGAVKENYKDTSGTPAARKWCTLDAAKWGKTENCEVSNTILISRPLNDGKNATGDFFDDLIVFRGKPWILTTEPCECKDGIGPANIFTASPSCVGCECVTCE